MASFLPVSLLTLVNDVLPDSFGKLVQDTTVLNRMLRFTNP